jgi:hypothetical protein
VILDRAKRDAMRESVGHIFAMEGDYLDHDYVGHEREGARSAIRRLTAGAGILDQLGWVQEGDRDSYRLEADDDISELMREWVDRLTQGGEAMDPVDQPMLRAWSRRRSLSSSLQGPPTLVARQPVRAPVGKPPPRNADRPGMSRSTGLARSAGLWSRTMAEIELTTWHVEIAPDESKPFSDCTRNELEAAARLITDRARQRAFSAGRERDEDAFPRRVWMRLTDQERRLFAVLEALKTVEEEQAKREDL